MPTATAVVGGWTVVVGIATAIWYMEKKKKQPVVPPKQAARAQQAPRKDPKPRRTRQDKPAGDASSSTTQDKENVPPMAIASGVDQGDEVDNKEFARQLTHAKAGTVLANKAQAGPRQRSIKQSRAQASARHGQAAGLASVAAGDADEDTSSSDSNSLADSHAIGTTSGGISDMLEKAAPGPSVMKVLAPTNPQQPKKPKTAPPAQPIETKKQRQNRKKAELNKQVNEEAEQQRKRLLEKQRRTAREAEGRAAKDGSAFMASRRSTTSAWSGPAAAKTTAQDSGRVPLLDTFDAQGTNDGAAGRRDEHDLPQHKNDEWANLPSEEDQIKFSLEESQNWEIVKGKEKRKKTNKGTELFDGQSSSMPTSSSTAPSIGSAMSGTSKSNSTTDDDQDTQRASKNAATTSRSSDPSHTNGLYKNFREKTVELVDSEWEVS